MQRFTKCLHRSGDHSLFEDADGNVSICDQSGDTPDQTDDGPLVVMPDAVCFAGFTFGHCGVSYRVPVIKLRGRMGLSCAHLSSKDFAALRAALPDLAVVRSDEFARVENEIRAVADYIGE